MFYEPREGHPLPHNPFKAIVAPRPIGWIGTRSKDGALNLAPYSFFNAICDTPPMVMFSSSGEKDSVSFIEETGEFTANLVSDHLKSQMNASSVNAPRGISEFEYAGLTKAPSRLIAAPRVKEAYAALECVAVEVKRLRDKESRLTDNYMVIGEVVGVHIDEQVLTDGLVDISKARPVSRLGYMDFGTTESVYQMFRPKWEDEK
ncbi:flavin reductase family protein [Ochrobactrum pecoris]|uniref:Flavin reductase (DIM6/NTAB) family NADH-FMN oxidoreductase RutF n=1 Tax=Brucella pecoris TaxID=867683 RepID=A0A5C5CJK0_9HYPH|nr:flavin reductase family protein [Brucella pecoris]MBB4094819.1 flavin reductase (DIM6/NTAB) family NADH-FMN oxidoreductase RutF [Brucella pecoris]NKW80285.1 flavin reductase family protein [Brucella pecoris]TNV11251.1 flavin reductase family protein [Brucella pecoris]